MSTFVERDVVVLTQPWGSLLSGTDVVVVSPPRDGWVVLEAQHDDGRIGFVAVPVGVIRKREPRRSP